MTIPDARFIHGGRWRELLIHHFGGRETDSSGKLSASKLDPASKLSDLVGCRPLGLILKVSGRFSEKRGNIGCDGGGGGGSGRSTESRSWQLAGS